MFLRVFLSLSFFAFCSFSVRQDYDEPVAFVKDMPHFKECATAEDNMARDACTRKLIKAFIADNIVTPDFKKKKRPKGTVFVKFIVNKKGKVTNVEILKGLHPKYDQASIDVIRKLPDFIPGRFLDKPVSVIYHVPIRFQ